MNKNTLKLLHYIGLTNLTDRQVELYCNFKNILPNDIKRIAFLLGKYGVSLITLDYLIKLKQINSNIGAFSALRDIYKRVEESYDCAGKLLFEMIHEQEIDFDLFEKNVISSNKAINYLKSSLDEEKLEELMQNYNQLFLDHLSVGNSIESSVLFITIDLNRSATGCFLEKNVFRRFSKYGLKHKRSGKEVD